MTYRPFPISTEDISLSLELQNLTELLAKNTHEVWAKERIAQGWTLGEERNDHKKTTPCLIPYENLPESEKIYDRNTALETIKLIIKLGYTISK